MRRIFSAVVSAVICSSWAITVEAADELVVYVFKDKNAATGLTVKLDGETERTLGEDGSASFDLRAGTHMLAVLDRSGEALHRVRFDTARGQYADISVALEFGSEPRHITEVYLSAEAPSDRALAPTGTLLGRITSAGNPLDDVEIVVEGTSYSTRTDGDGNYRLEIPRGVYTVTLTDEVLGSKRIENVRVVTGIERGGSFSIAAVADETGELSLEAGEIEELYVVAKFQPDALGEDERYASGVVDTLGIGELTRFGGTDIASSVIRVPSVSIKDGRFLFIRGLGGRYVTTTLNGALLPSTDPAKRTVPLDLFPTNFVNQLDVKKTFIASMPGESTGGNLVINTRTYPTEAEGRVSAQVGFVSDLTGEDVLADPVRGDFDWFGADDGSRGNASTYRAISDTLDQADYYEPWVEQELRRVGGILLQEGLDPKNETAGPKGVFGASYGNVFDLDWRDAEFGFFAAGNYRNKWKQRIDGTERTYSGQSNGAGTVEVEDDFSFNEYTNQIESSAMLNLGLTFGNSSFGSNTLASRVTSSRVKQNQGFDGDALLPSVRNILDWTERQFISQQFTGNHILGEQEKWVFDWQFTASRAERDAPDRREIRFDLQGQDGVYNLEVPNINRRYDQLEDNNFDLSADVDYLFDSFANMESTLSIGTQLIKRDRDSDSETYGFTGGFLLDDNAPNLSVNDVLNLQTITGDPSTGYAFDDKTLASDSYEAELDLRALYASYDTLIADSFQVIAGARWEDYDQTTETFSLQGADVSGTTAPVTSELSDSVVLPTLALNWFITDEHILRFAASQTVSRPDFKETSNATFYDPDFDIRIRGNPNLQTSDATNLDARYQFYWDEQDNISVAAFYKDLDDPIERVVQPASGTVGNTRTFINADAAEVYGVEFEGRKEWDFGSSMTQSFFVGGNIALIESEVELLNKSDRALQGQPEYILNLILGYDDIERNQELTLLLNQLGDTIVDVGVSGQPDIILEPRLDVTLNYRWYFADDWQFFFKGENLTDEDVEFTQGGNIYQSYRTGREWTFGLNWNF